MIHIQSLIDDAKCFETVRNLRWPSGVRCPTCDSDEVIKQGRDDTQPERQRSLCKFCERRFDALTDTICAGHYQPLRLWVLCLYVMGRNLSNQHIAKELDLHPSDAHHMTCQWRQGIVTKAAWSSGATSLQVFVIAAANMLGTTLAMAVMRCTSTR